MYSVKMRTLCKENTRAGGFTDVLAIDGGLGEVVAGLLENVLKSLRGENWRHGAGISAVNTYLRVCDVKLVLLKVPRSAYGTNRQARRELTPIHPFSLHAVPYLAMHFASKSPTSSWEDVSMECPTSSMHLYKLKTT